MVTNVVSNTIINMSVATRAKGLNISLVAPLIQQVSLHILLSE